MTLYGKMAGSAVAALSYLAEGQAAGRAAASVAEMARERRLSAQLLGQVLHRLARAGLVRGVRGARGGYALARGPGEITLGEVVGLFEPRAGRLPCPFGPHWCGSGAPCPLHGEMARLRAEADRFLDGMTLAVFAGRRAAAVTAAHPGEEAGA